jgi:hypothetical protein
MFSTIESIHPLTLPEMLLARLIGVASIVATLWVTLALYRRRTKEENEETLRLQNERETEQAMARLRRRHLDMVRARAADFLSSQSRALPISPRPTGTRATAPLFPLSPTT